MKFTISVVAAFVAFAAAAPSTANPASVVIDTLTDTDYVTEEASLAQGGFAVDLSAIEELEADGQSLPRDVFLEKRKKCGSLQSCVGHRCVRVVCFAMRPTSYCITYKYKKC